MIFLKKKEFLKNVLTISPSPPSLYLGSNNLTTIFAN